MSLTTILEDRSIEQLRCDCYFHLLVQKAIISKHFAWLKVSISGQILKGRGRLLVHDEVFIIEVNYSPFFPERMDRIYIRNKKIEYHDDIHVYHDLSLCLYHPVIDKPLFGHVPLYRMIPWVSEWCHFYRQWRTYRVWLGKEIKHLVLTP